MILKHCNGLPSIMASKSSLQSVSSSSRRISFRTAVVMYPFPEMNVNEDECCVHGKLLNGSLIKVLSVVKSSSFLGK